MPAKPKPGPAPLYDLTDGASQPDKDLLKDVHGADMRAAPTANSGFVVMVFYNVFAVLSFIFMLVSCFPVPVYKANSGSNKYTIWKRPNNNKWSDFNCDHQKQIFLAIQAFTIIATVFALVNVVAGVLLMLGKGHMGVTLMTGFLTFAVSLVSWALMVRQFHVFNCPHVRVYSRHSKLNAGFALCITACGLQMLGLIDLGYYWFTFYALPEYQAEDYNAGAFYATLLSFSILLLISVGAAVPLFEKWEAVVSDPVVDPPYWQYKRITLWHVQDFYVRYELPKILPCKFACDSMNNLMNAARVLAIMSPCFMFLSYLCCIGAVYKRFFKIPALAMTGVASVILLILWCVLLGVRYSKGCDAKAAILEGYVLVEGFGLIITGWIATLVIPPLLLFVH